MQKFTKRGDDLNVLTHYLSGGQKRAMDIKLALRELQKINYPIFGITTTFP
jgi:hypothetical protein